MIDLSYENIFRLIHPSLPQEWSKLVVRAVFDNESCNVKYYVQHHDKTYTDCFELGYDHQLLLEIIANVHQEIAYVRNQLEGKNKWNSVTVSILSDGAFETNYDYSKISLNADFDDKAWKEKFLKA